MIQRQQTLWLLLAAAAAVASFIFPFAVGDQLKEGSTAPLRVNIYAGHSFLLLLTAGISMILSAVTIFLYKNRQQQSWLCAGGVVISLLLLLLFFKEMKQLIKPVLALSSILPVLILGGFVMAFRGIRKDEKLVKSLDNLR